MCARADPQIHVGSRNPQLLKEHMGHIYVVVLTGMNEGLRHTLPSLQGTQDRSDLHEVRPSSNDVKYVHQFSRNTQPA